MGNAASQPSGALASPETEIGLYKACIRGDGPDKTIEWQPMGEHIRPQFYDINADASGSPIEWHLEFEGSVEYPDVVVGDGMQFQASELKCVFAAAEGTEWWALSFPDGVQFAAFQQRYNGYLFRNRYQADPNEENVKKELGVYAGVGRSLGETEESQQQWVEDMDIDDPAPAAPGSGFRARDRLVNRKASSELTSLVMGEQQRSFVVGREGIGVMRNTAHGLEDIDIELSFDSLRLVNTPQSARSTRARRSSFGATSGVSTPSTSASTPMTGCSKGILVESETKMNLLSSTGGVATIFNTDLERGGVVRELGFGDQTDIVDIVNEAKGTSGSSTTFLSIGPQSVDKWDTRVAEKGGLVQTMAAPTVMALEHDSGRSYKTKTNFSSIATTGKGYRAVGSRDGTIRLYSDQMGQVRFVFHPFDGRMPSMMGAYRPGAFDANLDVNADLNADGMLPVSLPLSRCPRPTSQASVRPSSTSTSRTTAVGSLRPQRRF